MMSWSLSYFLACFAALSLGSCGLVDLMKMENSNNPNTASVRNRPDVEASPQSTMSRQASAKPLSYTKTHAPSREENQGSTTRNLDGTNVGQTDFVGKSQTKAEGAPPFKRLSRRKRYFCPADAHFESKYERKMRVLQGGMLPGEEESATGDSWFHPPLSTKPCGPMGMCQCRGRCAWCLNLGRNLTFLPDLSSENVTYLNFSGNYLPHATRWSMANATYLQHLALDNSGLQAIDVDAFEDLQLMMELNLDSNPLGVEELRKALQSMASMRSLDTIGLSFMNLPDLPLDFFHPLKNRKVKFLYLNGNKMTVYDHRMFSPLTSLRLLDICANRLNEVFLAFDSHITDLNLFENELQTFPDFCQGGKAVFPRLEHLMLDENSINNIHPEKYSCLDRLQIFSIDENPIKVIPSNSFSTLKSIRVVFIQYMQSLNRIEGFAFNSSTLERVYMKGCHLHFDNHQINMSHAFRTCPRLQFLGMSTNQLQYSREYMWQEMFSGMASLTFLGIGDSHIPFLPRAVGLLRNLEKLSFAANFMESWDPEIFQNLTRLKGLFISKNKITTINASSFPVGFLSQLTALDLSENPFDCSCGLLWFLTWFHAHRHVIKSDRYTRCHMNGMRLRDFRLSAETCQLGAEAERLLPTLTSFLIAFLVVGLVLYRYRFRLYHVIHQVRYARLARQRSRGDDSPRFHAYVAYCDRDILWVVKEALPALEKDRGLKLCVRDRNFEVGAAKVDNIEANLAESSCMVLVVSQAALRDSWWQYECEVGVAAAVERARGAGLRLVLVLLEEVGPRLLDRSLQRLLQRSPYFTWHHLPEAKRLFWERLAAALRPAGHGDSNGTTRPEGNEEDLSSRGDGERAGP